jgi:general nucleoside transport system permease protein
VHAFLLLFAVILLAVGIWQVVRKGRMVQGVLAVAVGLLVGFWYFAADKVPDELTGTTPYVTTLLVLAFASQRLRMPAADGLIYRKGEGH